MQATVRKGVQAAERYVADVGGVIERDPVTHTFEQDSVNYVIHGKSLTPDKKQHIEKALNTVHATQKQLKEFGLGKSLDGLTVEIHGEKPSTVDLREGRGQMGDWVAGWYNYPRDELRLFPLGEEDSRYTHYTLVHELGHRVFARNLSERARRQWEDTINSARIEYSKEHIDKFAEKFLTLDNTYIKGNETGLHKYVDRSKVIAAVSKDDSEDKFVYNHLAKQIPYTFFSDDGRTIEGMKEHYAQNFKSGQYFSKEFVTDYANTNPTEMFAEVFAHYVLKGPGAVPPWTRAQFRAILRENNIQLTKSLDDETTEESPDFTQDIIAKEEKTYEQVKQELIGRGYFDSDFEIGGPLYGFSTNELVELVRDKRND
jgi:hypothetical protein